MSRKEQREDDFVDYYGVTSDMRELDSDVNEDPNREALLDESFERFYDQAKRRVQAKQAMTNVPRSSVFDETIDFDADDIP